MPSLPEVRPQDATPEIAAIYDQIKIVSGLPMVNLVWRHFAAYPRILRWAWDAISPVVGSTAMDDARRTFVASLTLPRIAPLGEADLRAANLTGPVRAHVNAVIDAYIRGNLTNIISLTALRIRLEHPEYPAAHFTPSTQAVEPAQIEPLPGIGSLDTRLAAEIRALARRHEGMGDDVIPSLYLAFSYWPEVIEALPRWLSSFYEPAAMRGAVADTVKLAESQAEAMLPQSTAPPEGISAVAPALERFTQAIIPGMIPICVALRRIIPES